MTSRYSLRFETGERRGETVSIGSERFTIGRRPGNTLQVVENSVSGRHAELQIDDSGIVVRDLGSTNGTRVGSDRILEMRVSDGAQLFFGNVGLTLIDASGAAPAAAVPVQPAASLPAADAADGADLARTVVHSVPDEHAVSAENLERARKSSKLGLVLFPLILVAAGGAWFWMQRSAGGGTTGVRPVEDVPGNLLAEDYSFEGDGGGNWSARESAPSSFLQSARARRSGAVGVRADLGPGEWAVHASPAVRVRPGKELVCVAELRAFEGGFVRLGIEFSISGEVTSPGSVSAWTAPLEGTDAVEYQAVELRSAVPAGYDRARAIVLAGADGRAPEGETRDAAEVDDPSGGAAVDADDVSLVDAGASGAPLVVDEYKFFAVGEPAYAATLFEVDHVLLSGLRVRARDVHVGRAQAPLVSERVENGFLVSAQGAPGATLSLRAEPTCVEGGIATIAPGGYAQHGVDFERAEVTDVLLGSGLDLLRLRFEAPVTVRGRPADGAFALGIELGENTSFLLQVSFREERATAVTLAAGADDAERRGSIGDCLRQWEELLDGFPYEEKLVTRAQAKRDQLVRAGRDELWVVEQEVKRARFFRLIDLFRQCRTSAEDVAARFAGSEVEVSARELAAEVDAELVTLEADLDSSERGRLGAILAILDAEGSELLAAELRSYIDQRFGGDR